MSNDMVRQEFGKDLGLAHEMVVTGRKVGADVEFYSALAHNEGLFRKTVAFVKGGGHDPTPSQRIAGAIMSRNFLGIEAVTHCLQLQFSDEQMQQLNEIPFSENLLQECRDSHILVAGFPLSILDLCLLAQQEKLRQGLYPQNWYEKEPFAQKRVAARWYLIRKEPVSGSPNRTFGEQTGLLSSSEEIPYACEVVYAASLYYLSTSHRLFEGSFVRCLDRLDESGNYHVSVGSNASDGLKIEKDWSAYNYHPLQGLASAKKLKVT